MAELSQTEVDACRQLFAQYDRNGTIPIDDLSSMLSALGFGADDVVSAQSRVADVDGSEGLDFERFLKIVQSQKETNTAVVDDTDTVEAFVALGGKADRSGKVLIDKLRATIKEFELTIDLDTLLSDLDKEQSGSIDFREFKSLLD